MVSPDQISKWPVGVPKTIDIPDVPLFSILDETVKKYPDRPALVLESGNFDKITKMNYQELGEATDKFSAFLVDKGVKPGDKIAVFLPNMIEFVIAYYGILKAGATVVSLNFQYPEPELTEQLIQSETKGIVCADMITPAARPYETCKAARDTGKTPLEFIVVASVKPYLKKIKAILAPIVGKVSKKDSRDTYMHEVLTKYSPEGRPQIELKDNKIAVIMFTGGTTGTPKGAVLLHKNLLANLLQGQKWFNPPLEVGKTVGMGSLPFYHSFGATTAMNVAIKLAGLCVLMLDPREDKFTKILELLEKYKCESFCAVPSLYMALLNHPKLSEFDLTSLRIAVSGAAPLPFAVLEEFEKVTGVNMIEGYGLTETSPIGTGNPMAPAPGSDKPLKKEGIGIPFPSTDVVILDIETGTKTLGPNEEGEIAISGPQVMQGYYKKPDETKNVMREINGKRYFLTGDIGKHDEDGYFQITDRKKDMIDVGGFKAYPREIEDVLVEHPKVSMAAAIGVPHPKVGETVKVFIVPKPEEELTKQEIMDLCEKNLVKYKRPFNEDYVEFRKDLPLSPIGKVLRRELKREEEEKA